MVIQVTQIFKKLVFWIKVLAEKKNGDILYRELTEFPVGWEGMREFTAEMGQVYAYLQGWVDVWFWHLDKDKGN